MSVINWNRFFLAITFFIHENNYFGWNYSPASAEECLADGIAILLLAMSFTNAGRRG